MELNENSGEKADAKKKSLIVPLYLQLLHVMYLDKPPAPDNLGRKGVVVPCCHATPYKYSEQATSTSGSMSPWSQSAPDFLCFFPTTCLPSKLLIFSFLGTCD